MCGHNVLLGGIKQEGSTFALSTRWHRCGAGDGAPPMASASMASIGRVQ